ncbi:MAG TPA: hypothetical protein DCK95_05630 [Anaerolineaceae bacterium]|nr:hypothetical protein [Anaerolineaceae bacterium]
MSYHIVTASDVPPEKLHTFLCRFFVQEKCNFLQEHGDWWHCGNHNRWVILSEENVVGYCAIIPTKIVVDHNTIPAYWWLDLIIAPEHRRRGLQSSFDKKLKEMEILKLGFPNETAFIHKKHSWGVRDDLTTKLLPLRPLKVTQVRKSSGFRKIILKTGAAVLSPIMSLYRKMLKNYKPKYSYRVNQPSVEDFAKIFKNFPPKNFSTTHRDAEYFTHRFMEAPYKGNLDYYVSRSDDQLTHYAITRNFVHKGDRITRILDLYGDFDHIEKIKDLLFCVISDAIKNNSTQITIMATLTSLKNLLMHLGFLFNSKARFCWLSTDHDLMTELDRKIYWTLADSDNDEIV